MAFPFLFGGTFIEASAALRAIVIQSIGFPFLFGGTFIEAVIRIVQSQRHFVFPFLFGGTFIEALR